MALDFPASPTTGQTFTGPNGVMWTWDGTKWVAGTNTGTTYAPIASPVFTGDPRAPTPAPGDNDTSIATSAFVQAAVAPALANVGRNLIHNPLFNVAQRGAGPFTAQGYTLDRWTALVGIDAISVTQAALADADRAAIGDEAATAALQTAFTGNAAAGAFNILGHRIEGVRRLAGKTVTVSFWAKAASGTPKIGLNVAQSPGTGGSPSGGGRVLTTGLAVTLSTTWTRYNVTIALPSSSGWTLGTNGDNFTILEMWLSSGATNNASAGNIGVQSGTINLWGVQLEIGSVATQLEKPDPRYDLANCQRFYQTGLVYLEGYGNTSALGAQVSFTAMMRGIPTVALIGLGYANASGAVVNGAATNTSFPLRALVTAPGGAYVAGVYTASADL